LCCEDEFFKQQALTRPSLELKKDERLPQAVDFAVLQIIEAEFNMQRRIDSEKRYLATEEDYTPEACFEMLADKKDNIEIDDLRAFIPGASESVLSALIRRIDINDDNKLSLAEWNQFMVNPAAEPEPVPQKAPEEGKKAAPADQQKAAPAD